MPSPKLVLLRGPQLMRSWWIRYRGEIGKDALVALAVGIALFLAAMIWDDRLADRRIGSPVSRPTEQKS